MATLWDREVSDEVEEALGQLSPRTRLELVLRVLEWTRDALPSTSRALMAEEAGRTVDAAIDLVRRSASGAPPGDSTEDVLDELFEWSDDLRVERLWQLFNALTYCVGVRADDATAEMALETMSACYDVIRDGERLPEFAVGTPEGDVLAVERANANCMNAIDKQRRMAHDALRRESDR